MYASVLDTAQRDYACSVPSVAPQLMVLVLPSPALSKVVKELMIVLSKTIQKRAFKSFESIVVFLLVQCGSVLIVVI